MSCKIKEGCACTYPGCPRHGKCCNCIEHHNAYGVFPACAFSPEAERRFDRSYEALKRDREKRK